MPETNPDIPFQPDEWVLDRHKPGAPGQYTGKWRQAGPQTMLQLSFPGGTTTWRPLSALESITQEGGDTLNERLRAGNFGKREDLRRLITFEKLKGTLHEVIYSMEAAQIDFYPYQFKPVVKFINSPTERLIIADEVGLGKTIESALIWMELQARRQAKRLLVVCPRILAEKWRAELRDKFLIDARIADFRDLQREVAELKNAGPAHPFALISTYSGLRPPKSELDLLDEEPAIDGDDEGAPKTQFLRDIRHWSLSYDPFDLVVFDEAHYMRNPATTTFHLGECLAANAGGVLCVSATPVNNSNRDLHSLLRLIDENFFESQGMFEELLEANRPAIQAINALARTPVDQELLARGVEGMGESNFINQSPLFHQFLGLLETLDISDKAALAKCQDIAEKLNLLGSYINRTRRIQVAEERPLRDPRVLTVEFTEQEMQLYKIVLEIVRRKCRKDSRPFHIFQVMGLQLRAASCLPMLADEIKSGRFGDAGELFEESFGGEIWDDLMGEQMAEEELSASEVIKLLDYDFAANDSKYKELRMMLADKLDKDEKVVIFAYYRNTLSYLRRRLMEDGISVAVIHGGVDHDMRWDELDRFKDPRGPRVLLSSEVGSEGIDLQFCRVLVNYDLPWNPMRVEQRIGRIDRVGQKAKRLSIVNFKVEGTIEERLYDRLHAKLNHFANSLGDLENIIGTEVKQLTVDLLSKNLTEEEENNLVEQAERVIEGKLIQIRSLEESGDALIALSDYVQRKISEDRERGRYVLPIELENYLRDFFERNFQGCEVNYNTPYDNCMRIRLTSDAQGSLAEFIRDDRSLGARFLRQREFQITLHREALERLSMRDRKTIHFINHLSPLIRWITKLNREREHGFIDIAALKLATDQLPPGDYVYRIERWKLQGLMPRETMGYGIASLGTGEFLPAGTAEGIMQDLLREGTDWHYVDCDLEALSEVHESLEENLGGLFGEAVQDFQAENDTMHQIKIRRVTNIFDRRIEQDQQRLRTLREMGRRESVIRATEGRLRVAHENKQRRIDDLDEKAAIDMEQAFVAAGVFRVTDVAGRRNPPP